MYQELDGIVCYYNIYISIHFFNPRTYDLVTLALDQKIHLFISSSSISSFLMYWFALFLHMKRAIPQALLAISFGTLIENRERMLMEVLMYEPITYSVLIYSTIFSFVFVYFSPYHTPKQSQTCLTNAAQITMSFVVLCVVPILVDLKLDPLFPY